MMDAADLRLTRHRSFVLFWCARTFSSGAYMMQGVAVGWQIYDLTNDPLDLGLVGLAQFFPLIAMSVVAGQLSDLFDRRLVAAICQAGKALAAIALSSRRLGVLGPTRMDYPATIATVRAVARYVGEMLAQS